LSKKEGRVGSPEKPLSGLGEVTYKRYWKIKVFEHLRNAPDTLTMDGKSVLCISTKGRSWLMDRNIFDNQLDT
jgi:hypothetical protein